MLDVFRKRGAMSVLYSGLLGAVIVVFIIQFRPNANSPLGSLSRKCVAKVRGTCIDEKEWRAQRYLLRGPYEGGPSLNYNKAAIDSLVERTLLEQEAERLGMRVTEDDVMFEIVRGKVHVMVPTSAREQASMLGVSGLGFRMISFGTKDKPFDQQTFDKTVHSMTGQNVDEFTEAQEHELLAARMLTAVMDRVRVTDAEAWDQYKHEKSTTTIRSIRFDAAYFADRFAQVDAASIDAWAGAHKTEVDAAEAKWPKDHEKRLIHPRHILIEAKKEATTEQKTAARKKADEIVEKLKKGEDFAKLAKESSTDPGSKDKGGEYDWTSGYEYVPEFRDGIAALKLGDTSVVETQYGFHVIQILGRYDGRTAVAFNLYREARGGELAKEAADKVTAALKGKLPVVLDDALKAKVEEAKKAGKLEADAAAGVLDDEARARLTKAIDETLASMAPPPPKVEEKAAKDEKKEDKKEDKKDEKKDEKKDAAPPPPPAWQTDDRKPRIDDSSPLVQGVSPVEGVADPKPLIEAVGKLTKEAPVAPVLKAGKDLVLMVLRDKHEATRAEFDKDKALYLGKLLMDKRRDAAVNYVVALRESLNKDQITVDQRYVTDEKQKGPGGEPVAPIEEP